MEQEKSPFERLKQPEHIPEPALSEVEYLRANRLEDGSLPEAVLQDAFDNILSDGYEAVIPHGVARFEQMRHGRDYYWMGKSSVQMSRDGHHYHTHQFAHDRVGVEEDEAIDARDNLTPGMVKVLISPRAKGTIDATDQEAKDEQLDDKDMVRIQYLKTDEAGMVTAKVVESAQLPPVPVSVWVRFLQDPDNLFGRPVFAGNHNSALAVMETHRETYLTRAQIPGGVVDIARALIDYADDDVTRAELENHVERLTYEQDEIRARATRIAEDRLHFLAELADSLDQEVATEDVAQYVNVFYPHFQGQQKLLVDHMHRADGSYAMNDDFAELCADLNKFVSWVRAGVVTGNAAIIRDVGLPVAERIHGEEVMMVHNDMSWQQRLHMMTGVNQQIATSGVKSIGSGCSLEIENMFASVLEEASAEKLGQTGKEAVGEEKYDFDKEMHCVVCQAPPKEEEPKKMCGPCGICKTCDTKLRRKTKAA